VTGRRKIAVLVGAGLLAGCGGTRSSNNDSETTVAPTTATSSATTGPKLDVGGSDTDDPPPGCAGGGFSNIWIANTPENTVSKIDTVSGEELGRYITGPSEQASPSRTSVSLYGDVVVANRGEDFGGFGGLTKIVARTSDCIDLNQDGEIQTSSGPDDVLPWGTDECVVWNRMTPSLDFDYGPRPVAWEGKLDAEGCPAPDPRLWFGWYDADNDTGKFVRLSSDNGVLDEVDVPDWSGLTHGPYGGAVNSAGDFWIIGWQQGPLVRIDGTSLAVERIDVPSPPAEEQRWSYGMSLDQYGNPWVANAGTASVYDVASGQWTNIATGNRSLRGMMVDSEDRAWFAVDFIDVGVQGCGLAVVDAVERTLIDGLVEIEGCVEPVGVSIDAQGYVWVVDVDADAAFKIDPDTYEVVLRVDGLNGPYTYSDMTGRALNLVVNPQG
jgi:streptogramin lyase